MTCTKKLMNKKAGYSLIEIVIYIIIISVICNVIVLSVSNIEKTKLRNDGIMLKNIIYEMQNAAIFTGLQHGAKFENSKEFYTYNVKNEENINVLKKYSLSGSNFLLQSNAYENKVNYTNRGTITKACELILASNNYKIKLTIDIGSGNLTLYEVESR